MCSGTFFRLRPWCPALNVPWTSSIGNSRVTMRPGGSLIRYNSRFSQISHVSQIYYFWGLRAWLSDPAVWKITLKASRSQQQIIPLLQGEIAAVFLSKRPDQIFYPRWLQHKVSLLLPQLYSWCFTRSRANAYLTASNKYSFITFVLKCCTTPKPQFKTV